MDSLSLEVSLNSIFGPRNLNHFLLSFLSLFDYLWLTLVWDLIWKTFFCSSLEINLLSILSDLIEVLRDANWYLRWYCIEFCHCTMKLHITGVVHFGVKILYSKWLYGILLKYQKLTINTILRDFSEIK